VELVWNGKTNEVCNVVLPFQLIEQVDEESFNKYQPKSFEELIAEFREYKKQGGTEKRRI